MLIFSFLCTDSDRIAEYDMKLMDIDSDTLGIPDTEYDARVTMPSSEFTRIVRDLSQLGESVRIEVSKEGVRFASEGEAANGSVLLKQAEGATISGGKITAAKDGGEDGTEEKDGDGEEAEASTSQKKIKVKKEKKGDEDVEMDDEDGEKEKEDGAEKGDGAENEEDADFRPDVGEEEKDDEEVEEENEDEDGSNKKRKKKVTYFLSLLKPRFGLLIYPSPRQTALGNQVKNLKLPNRRKGRLLKMMTRVSMVSSSR